MPWCPNCKNEYVEGTKVCADCGMELVESLEEVKSEPLIFGEKEQMERLKKFLAYNGLRTASIEEDKTEGVFELYVRDEERQKASMAVRVFLQQEAEMTKAAGGRAEQENAADVQPLQEEGSEGDIEEGAGNFARIKSGSQPEGAGRHKEAPAYKSVYQSSAQRAEENRSSGYMLIVVGGIGLAAIVLILSGVISLPAAMANKYMVCAVTGALFLLFFVMGIFSVKSSKKLEQEAESENSLAGEIRNWCGQNMTARTVDEGLSLEEEPGEEMKYFKRTEKMKRMIAHQFLNLDEGFLDSFVDDYYAAVYEQNTEEQ